MGYSPSSRIAAACRHAAAAAHAALLLRRVCVGVSPSAAVPFKRQPLHRAAAAGSSSCSSSCWHSSSAAAGAGSFARAAARAGAPPRRHYYLQHPTRTFSLLKPASSAFALLPCPSSLRRCAAALQSFSLSASTVPPSPQTFQSSSSSNFCCSSSRCVSSTSASSKTPGETAARGAKEAAGFQGEQQEEEDPSGASRAPGATAAARAATQQETQAAASTGRNTTEEAASRTSAERGEAESGDRQPHKPATGPSDVHEGGAIADTPAIDQAYTTLLEKYRVCLEEVETLRRKAETLQDKALRALADMENARVRHQRELARTKDYAASDFAKAMLEVADSMAYATKALRATLPPSQQQQWEQQQQMAESSPLSVSSSSSSNAQLTTEQLKHIYEGVAMTESLLHRTLDRFGVQQFDPTGEVFNPAVHEALFEIDDPTKEKGRVAQVIQMGYKIKDRVLRAAKVGVARGGSGNSRAP